MTVEEVAGKAADYIREHGWIQGNDGSDEEGRACVIVAIDLVGDGHNVSVRGAIERVRTVIGGQFISVWNDHPGRTKEEVLAVLDKVAGRV